MVRISGRIPARLLATRDSSANVAVAILSATLRWPPRRLTGMESQRMSEKRRSGARTETARNDGVARGVPGEGAMSAVSERIEGS